MFHAVLSEEIGELLVGELQVGLGTDLKNIWWV